ncbi:MAG: signal peptidase II [Lachnospiraceae bacterium]|nr:signal peptidase II [Lachnospiraceae bacterium]
MIWILVLLSVFLVDLCIKKYAEANLKEEKQLFGGKILVRLFHNDGIAMGMLSEHQEAVRKGTFGMMGGLMICFISLLFQKGRTLRKAGLSLLLGGALCNWFDRFHQRTVTDYFSFNVRWKRLRNIVFNLSDLCIIAGLILAMLGGRRKYRRR